MGSGENTHRIDWIYDSAAPGVVEASLRLMIWRAKLDEVRG